MATAVNSQRRVSLVNTLCLFTISILNFLVHSQASCPIVCTCDHEFITVSCTNAMLNQVPHDLPPSTQNLDLHGNHIFTLQATSLANLTQLHSMDLSENGLQDIHSDTFSDQTNLQILHLENNQLNSSVWPSLQNIGTLSKLYLGNNKIDEINSNITESLGNLVDLDISKNYLSSLPDNFLPRLWFLRSLNISGNNLVNFTLDNNASDINILPDLNVLDLSANQLINIDPDAFYPYPMLKELDLSCNNLTAIQPQWFSNLTNLTSLSLDQNPLADILDGTFHGLGQLETLHLSHLPALFHIHHKALTDLNSLETLIIKNNPKLEYLHVDMFSNLTSLRTLDLSYNSLSSIYIDTFLNLASIESVSLKGNSWSCDCDLKWLYQWILFDNKSSPIFNPSDVMCNSPESIHGLSLLDIEPYISCSGPITLNFTEFMSFKLGSAAVIDCPVFGDPKPEIVWTTARNLMLYYHPAYINNGRDMNPGDSAYHINHIWHDSDEYFRHKTHEEEGRIHVLQNGSLYIDYVLRKDTGPYTCFAQNGYGNATAFITLRLDYTSITDAEVASIIIGFLSAAGFFLLGIIVGAIRYVSFKCSKEQRQKRKSIRQILETLEAYKTSQFDRLSAYKTAKIDQLSAFRHAKVDKLKNYKTVTVTTLVHYLHRMREHYSHQIAQVRSNCTTKAERLRDNYNTQMCKFKDYRSHQIERIRDNYQGQFMKIREYGSSQMEKLREQYKLQQQHVLKLMEILDIGNCMTVIEAECMRTESMLFDPELNLDFDTHPVHIPYIRNVSNDPSESDYQTAESLNSLTIKDEKNGTESKVKISHRQHQGSRENKSSVALATKPHVKKHKKTYKKQKYSKKSSNRQSQDSNSEDEEGNTNVRKAKPERHKPRDRIRTANKPPVMPGTDDSSTDAAHSKVTAIKVPQSLPLSGTGLHSVSPSSSRPHHKSGSSRDPAPSKIQREVEHQPSSEYESAHESQQPTPDVIESTTPSPTTPSFTSISSPSSLTLTPDDNSVVVGISDDENTSLSEEPVTLESRV